MPALPWKARTVPQAGTEYVAFATMLPLRNRMTMAAMLRHTFAVRSVLARSDGLVGYALDAELTRNVFWTVSAWADRAALDTFARSEPHRAAKAAVGEKLLRPKLISWTCDGSAVPISWITARNRLLS